MSTPSSSKPERARLLVDGEHGVARLDGVDLLLTARELAVLAALAEVPGRVVPRRALARRAGLADASPRRCDNVLVGLRRALGAHAVQNVRGRGWMLVLPDDDNDAQFAERLG